MIVIKYLVAWCIILAALPVAFAWCVFDAGVELGERLKDWLFS